MIELESILDWQCLILPVHIKILQFICHHRIVDDSLGATFLTAVANELENFDVNRQY